MYNYNFIICGILNFMLKKFNPMLEDMPTLYNEDVYLFVDSGRVISGRHGGAAVKNIFDLIDDYEYAFVRENMLFSGLKPLLLVQSKIGPIFIDNSLFGSYRLLIAIVPHFSSLETLALMKSKLQNIVLPSKNIKVELEQNNHLEFDSSHEEFVNRLIGIHRGAYYYRVHGRTNGELSMMMSEIAYDYSEFCGCLLELTVNGVGLFEMKNNLCVDSYLFALTSLLFLARNYSKSGKAKMDIFFDKMGVYFEYGFEIASDYDGILLLQESEELKNFKLSASSRLLDCDYYQSGRVFAIRVYPWFKHPDSADIKERRREFIYNI